MMIPDVCSVTTPRDRGVKVVAGPLRNLQVLRNFEMGSSALFMFQILTTLYAELLHRQENDDSLG